MMSRTLRNAHPHGYPLNRLVNHRESRIEFGTPLHVFDHFNTMYHFYMDVCATKQNHKARRYFTVETDALTQDWIGPAWMNPPYTSIRKWIEKAYLELLKNCTVVALLPAWTGDSWFQDFVVPFADVTFLRKRLKFVGPLSGGSQATFASVVAVWPRSAAVRSATAQQMTVNFDL